MSARGLVLLLALGVTACRKAQHVSAGPNASAAGPLASLEQSYQAKTRQTQLATELARAQARFGGKPTLGDCAGTLPNPTDQALCQAATRALSALEAEPSAAPEQALRLLGEGALALARFSERMRYLSLAEISDRSERRGVVPGAASAAPSAAKRPGPLPRPVQGAAEIKDGPIARLMATTVHLERDVMRNLGAYLEYGELPVRRAAFETVQGLRAAHPQWQLLESRLREAALLEADPQLKRELEAFIASGLPSARRRGQSPDSK